MKKFFSIDIFKIVIKVFIKNSYLHIFNEINLPAFQFSNVFNYLVIKWHYKY